MTKVFLVGIAGGTGSGKTTLARSLVARYGERGAALLDLDSYYRDLSHLPLEERTARNFDEPSAVDFDLLARDVERLVEGKAIAKPRYSFREHARTGEFERVEPARLIVVEGLLAYWDWRVRGRMGLTVFLDAAEQVRLARRLDRDIRERGRTEESVREQFDKTVRPMHRRYIEPLRSLAALVLDTTAASVESSLVEILSALAQAFPELDSPEAV